MSKKNRKKTRVPPQKRSTSNITAMLIHDSDYESLCVSDYIRLSDNPEIKAAVQKVAQLVSSMSIHLMENGESGDTRVKNELSRLVDIYPNPYMTRKTFIENIIQTLMLEGNGNAVVLPITNNGWIESLQPIPASAVTFQAIQSSYGYQAIVNGQTIDPENICHFVMNPDRNFPWKGTGYQTTLKDVAKNLKQAAATKNGFMSDKWKPSLIIKVDSDTEELSTPQGRSELTKKYIETAKAGEPWLIPAEMMDVVSVKPLSLNDLAINEAVNIDKKTAAAILGVPEFVVGVGTYSKDEWNNFINTTIKNYADIICGELTRKLLYKPTWYFRMSLRSLYAYDINTLANIGMNMYQRGLMFGNEVRDWIGLSPIDGLDERVILENYIPAGMIGDQKKLIQGGEKDGNQND